VTRNAQVVAGALALLATGCFSAKRAECELLTTTANADLEAIERDVADVPPDPPGAAERLDAIAARYEGLSQRVSKLGFGTAELQAQAIAYHRLTGDAAAATRRLAAAVRAGDPAVQHVAEQEFEQVASRQQQLVTQVNAFCGR
jgi:hypothetical protein